MFAIIATGGKQINVEVGKEYFVEKLAGEANGNVIFDQVLMIDGTVGQPLIKGAEVHATIIKQDKAKKVIVFKYRPKKNSKSKYGHRQPYTKVKITDIFLSAKDKAQKEAAIKKDEKPTTTEVNKEIEKVAKPTSSTNEKTTVNNLEEKIVETTTKK
ncbi:50S ribosomal protein L21 [Spiroplasma platyhelix PALS-1]|uniref:Large ribosomal subunit protein bL21 n=1 Tax=Spiroplasma platyhelix PALS-1 TaxID=1276218 RepID=A0A846U949_9MOLU|nr:50S ribosomal protein L21 [Spiroplasma platyhelix PALS-1]NKE38403.1 50S ribosomal protein L21 [Spiroplasma platyhelix PALS-1]UJB29290.1 50S ribosomal protein L21 [Spiroplasma platyhelix PALS-1]